MKKLTFKLLLFVAIFSNIHAQTDTLYYLHNDFETDEEQDYWTNSPSGEKDWTFRTGGEAYPNIAASGTYNASLYYRGEVYNTNLVSESIDLSFSSLPTLSFYYSLAKSLFGTDELRVLFKAGAGHSWDTVKVFDERQDDWEQIIMELDSIDEGDPYKYFVEDFQIAFLGTTEGGQGALVDLVVIAEEDTIKKFIRDYKINSLEKEIIPSGSFLPIARIDLKVLGNTGGSYLNSIKLKLEEGDASYFKTNSFRLYATNSEVFKTKDDFVSTQIGTDAGITDDKIEFSGLGYDMELGYNYIWITTEIAETAPHGADFSFSFESGAISAIDSIFPSSGINSFFEGTISEAVFFDNFETDKGWDIGGDFERAIPLGYDSYSGKNQDPDYAFSHDYVLGTDLTGDGLHLIDIGQGTSYAAITPMVDLLHYNNVKIYMQEWCHFFVTDNSTISISNNGGKSWTTIWENQLDKQTPSTDWTELVFEGSDTKKLERSDSVMVKFSVDSTTGSWGALGFNIDDFAIVANLLDADLGITQIKSPFDECLDYGNDTVRAVFKNYAAVPTQTDIPVFFGLYGIDSTLVWDTIPGPIDVNDSIVFTFKQLANFPRGDNYSKFIVGHALPGDEDASNDKLTKPLVIPDNITPSHTENFEYSGGVWSTSTGSTWECLEPDVGIGLPDDSEKAWVLSPYGNYGINDTSYIISACYDLTNANRNIIEFDYFIKSEADKDGFTVEFTTDDGTTWNPIPASAYQSEWGWYTSTVECLGQAGVSGILNGWHDMHELLPASLAFEPKVKFRILWAANADISYRGAAIDNFSISPAPIDVGVCHIATPVNSCLNTLAPTIELSVKNYGYNDVLTSDTIIIGIDLEGGNILKDTLTLASTLIPGDSATFIIDAGIEVPAGGNYSITAYTLVEDDPYFYNANNDSLSHTFTIWPLPDAMLTDTIESREPDTVVIRGNSDPLLSYIWSHDSTGYVVGVTGPGTYYTTVTESTHGCINYDSCYVELLFNDVGVDSILTPVTACENPSDATVKVRIKNFGTDSLIASDVIYVVFAIDETEQFRDTITLTENLYERAYIDYEMKNGTIDVSSATSYNISAYTIHGGDTVATNDKYAATMYTWGYPTVDIGSDVSAAALEYTFDAGAGFVSYNWSTGDTTQQITTGSSGTYSVTIYDANGCPDTDTANLWLKVHDIELIEMTSPISNCGGSEEAVVSVTVKNNGSDTLQTGENITYAYSLNGDAYQQEISPLSSPVLPGVSWTYDLANTADISPVQTHHFDLVVEIGGDLRPENDSIQDSIVTSLQPVVDFGPLVVEIKAFDTTLDAGYGENFVYDWHNDFDEQIYTVTYSGTYWVNVTDTVTGCTDGDTIVIDFDILDYEVTSIGLNNSYCEGENIDSIVVTVSNNSSWERDSAWFDLVYSMNGSEAKSQYFKIKENWPVETGSQTKTFTIKDDFTIDATGNLDFDIAVKHDGDMHPENDTLTKTFLSVESPDFAFEDDTLKGYAPYVIEAESGFTSYLWEGTTSGQTYTVYEDEDGMYSLKVSNVYGCSTEDSVYVDVSVVGFEENLANTVDVNIYPNPAIDKFYMEFSSKKTESYWVEIYNSKNQLLFKKWITSDAYKIEYDAQSLMKGVYFIRVTSDEAITTHKVVIQ